MEKTTEKKKYFVVRERAVPEVLLKVVQAKRLLDSGRAQTVQDAAEQTGISRSSFYKYMQSAPDSCSAAPLALYLHGSMRQPSIGDIYHGLFPSALSQELLLHSMLCSLFTSSMF